MRGMHNAAVSDGRYSIPIKDRTLKQVDQDDDDDTVKVSSAFHEIDAASSALIIYWKGE